MLPIVTLKRYTVLMLKVHNITTLIDHAEPEVRAWFASRTTKCGRRRLAEARQLHSALSIAMGGGRKPYFLTMQESSAKLAHNAHITAWEQVVMYLSAHRLSGVVNFCPDSTPECRAGCLEDSGHLAMDHAKVAMRCRSIMLAEHTADALILIVAETERNAKRVHACGKSMAQRLNGTSDQPWERNAWFLTMLREAGTDQHFDYTKTHTRVSTEQYYLAPSATERTTEYRAGMVVVVDVKRGHDLPTSFHGFPVIDGDHENGDLRFLDQARPDAIVLIRAKGHLVGVKGRERGFVKRATDLVTMVELSARAA